MSQRREETLAKAQPVHEWAKSFTTKKRIEDVWMASSLATFYLSFDLSEDSKYYFCTYICPIKMYFYHPIPTREEAIIE